MKVEQIPVPKPGPNEVLVKVHAAGVNPVDAIVRMGVFMVRPQTPYTCGSDGAGVVQAVGAGVTKVKPGDRVFFTKKSMEGGYAEYNIVPDFSCWLLPQRLTFAQGAGIPIPYFTAYRCIFHLAHAKANQSILIHGASGAVGLAAVQLARAYGMTVYGTAGTDIGLKLVKENGAHHVFNHRTPEYANELVKATNGQGVDLILEMVASANLGKDLELLKRKGKIIVIGTKGPSVEINPGLLMGKDATIHGMILTAVNDVADWDDIAAALTAGFTNGTLTPIVDKEYPLEKATDAQRDIAQSSGAKGNLILNPELRS